MSLLEKLEIFFRECTGMCREPGKPSLYELLCMMRLDEFFPFRCIFYCQACYAKIQLDLN
jgi:hypothetical protein